VTASDAGRVVLRQEDAILTIDPALGARFASLVVNGHELLVTEGEGPIRWGCYPMAPFAGRIRAGRFAFQGRAYGVPVSMPPNAIHGTVLDRSWEVIGQGDDHVELATDLGPYWPFAGQAIQAVALVPGGLEATLEVRAAEPMPVVIGWHPWFRREIGGASVALDFEARWMYERDPDGLPTGATVPPTPRPWDDAFSDIVVPPRLTWPGAIRLDLRSTAPFWVVFDEEPHAICVEPQTAPPDAFNLAAAIGVEPPSVTPERPATVAMAWRWTTLGPPPTPPRPKRQPRAKAGTPKTAPSQPKPAASQPKTAASQPKPARVTPSTPPRTRRARSRP
jgi:aldose 1-epimerase